MFVKKGDFLGMNVVSMSPVHMCCGSGGRRRFGRERYIHGKNVEPRKYERCEYEFCESVFCENVR